METLYPNSHIASAKLHSSRLAFERATGRYPEHTPPSPGHYWDPHFWDEIFHVVIDAINGTSESLAAAMAGQRTLFRGQHEDGFVPNVQNLGPRRRIELERTFGYDSDNCSNYLQAPISALGLSKTVTALRHQQHVLSEEAEAAATAFLEEMYPKNKPYYEYIDKYRSVAPDDRRMFIVHPHETGRDSDPTYDYLKPYRIPRIFGRMTPIPVSWLNSGLDYAQSLQLSHQLKKAGGDITRAREVCGAVDVMMNCMLVDNLHTMAGLAQQLNEPMDVRYFTQYANDVEEAILTKNWFPEARAGRGAFYSTDREGNPIIETSINNLFQLVLPHLSEDQFESTLDLMDESFDTPFPLPSVGTTSRNFDPYNREFERLWRGGKWMPTDWYLKERGLDKQQTRPQLIGREDLLTRGAKWSQKILTSSQEVVSKSGLREFYNPLTAAGQRRRTRNFGWSNLVYIMKPAVSVEYLAEAA